MKKIIVFLIMFCFLFTGCDNVMNTPTKRVEEFLNQYQKMDDKVLMQLDEILMEDTSLTEEQKVTYKEIMKNQYKNLVYTIKEETVDGDNATVKVEIEVYDYNKAILSSDNYLITNQQEFLNEDGTINNESFMDYKIKQMKDTNEKVKYTLELTLTKEEDKWKMDDISEIDRQKIHGIYNY